MDTAAQLVFSALKEYKKGTSRDNASLCSSDYISKSFLSLYSALDDCKTAVVEANDLRRKIDQFEVIIMMIPAELGSSGKSKKPDKKGDAGPAPKPAIVAQKVSSCCTDSCFINVAKYFGGKVISDVKGTVLSAAENAVEGALGTSGLFDTISGIFDSGDDHSTKERDSPGIILMNMKKDPSKYDKLDVMIQVSPLLSSSTSISLSV
jgi:hypothetical protein